jgi:hypothetical protein
MALAPEHELLHPAVLASRRGPRRRDTAGRTPSQVVRQPGAAAHKVAEADENPRPRCVLTRTRRLRRYLPVWAGALLRFAYGSCLGAGRWPGGGDWRSCATSRFSRAPS